MSESESDESDALEAKRDRDMSSNIGPSAGAFGDDEAKEEATSSEQADGNEANTTSNEATGGATQAGGNATESNQATQQASPAAMLRQMVDASDLPPLGVDDYPIQPELFETVNIDLDKLPYLARRKAAKDERHGENFTAEPRPETEELKARVENQVKNQFPRNIDIKMKDFHEAVYRAGLQNPELIEQEMRDMGYGMTLDEILEDVE